MPPVWMPGCKVVPSLDRQVTDAMISPVSHSEGSLDRTASMAINGFGINGAAGADGSRYSVLLARKSTASAGMSTRISNEMEIALMRQQLRRGDVLNRDGIVGGIGDDGVAVRIVVDRGKQGVEA